MIYLHVMSSKLKCLYSIHTMTRHINILCDYNYINYAVALIYSIKMNSSLHIILNFLCLDEATYDIISNLNFTIHCFKESDILHNTQLIYLKNTDRTYYIYTLSSYFTNYIMLNNDDCDSVMYIDADIYFHKDIQYLYDAFQDTDVGIFRHRFENDDIMTGAGKFNVGVVYFKKSKKGKQVLDWWTDAVLYRKYAERGLNTMGDQKYLDEFPVLCNENEIFIDGDVGHGAPWNWNDYDLSNIHNYEIAYKSQKQMLIFTHFSKFICDFEKNTYNANWHGYYPLTNNGKIYNNKNLKKIHDEYFISLKNAVTIVNNIQKNKQPKIAVGMIVFESDYVLQQCLDQIYPFVDQILITEGPVKFWQDKGKTTSMDNTNFILDNYNDYDHKITLIHGQFEEKTEECNSYIPYIREDIEYLWQIDADEIYTIENILKIKEMLLVERPTSVGVRSCTFYGGFDSHLTGFEQKNDNFLRIFKFMKGVYWKTHRPPTIEYPVSIETKHISSDELFHKWNIQMHHYSYVFPTQVKYKMDYYANYLNRDGIIPNYYNDVYLKWVTGTVQQKIAIEYQYNGVHEFTIERRGDCYTVTYDDFHPETIRRDFHLLKERFKSEIFSIIHENSKNTVTAPLKQFKLNKAQLMKKDLYPDHWNHLIYILKFVPMLYLKTFHDVLCRDGSTYQLLKNNNYDLNYKGFDYSIDLVQTAKEEWKYDQFYAKNIYQLCDFGENDVIYADGLLDSLLDSDNCLGFILKLNAEYVILNRIAVSSKHEITTHTHNLDTTICYIYEEHKLLDIIASNNYRIKHREGSCFLLEHIEISNRRMGKMVMSWKHPLIPLKQVVLHKDQLSNGYPTHWNNLLKSLLFIENVNSFEFHEFGCGIGTTYKLLKDNDFDLNYHGFDFSESMIVTAKKTWNYEKYYVKDIYAFTSFTDKCILYVDGTIDIQSNAHQMLTFILQLNAHYVILNRIQIGDECSITTHFAYDLFHAIEYVFDKKQFFNIIYDNKYKIMFSIDTLFLLEKQ